MIQLKKVNKLMEEGIADGVFPGACYAVGFKEVVSTAAFGRHMYCPESAEVTIDTLWDLASLTKVAGCTAAAMLMVEQGKLKLDEPVASVLPEFAAAGKQSVTPRHLLLHDSGLPAGLAFHKKGPGWTPQRCIADLMAAKLEYPTGTKTVYSDLSMVMLGKLIEKLAGQGLDVLLQERIYGPLGMSSTMYRPPQEMRARCAPTEAVEDWRQRVRAQRGIVVQPPGARCHPDEHIYVQGEVHDPTAFMIDGVSGNAGLFSTIGDLARFATMMLQSARGADQGIITPETIREWTRRQGASSTRGLGWDTRSEKDSSAGHRFSMQSFGHTGYTGTSIWIDPEHELFAVLLSNRVHPVADQGDHQKIKLFRPVFHDAVARACL